MQGKGINSLSLEKGQFSINGTAPFILGISKNNLRLEMNSIQHGRNDHRHDRDELDKDVQ